MQTDKSLRAHLRAATQSRHATLDRMIGPVNSRETYVGYLRGIAAFRIPVEQRLATLPAWPDRLGSWRPTFLARWLRLDLTALQLDVPSGVSGLDLSSDSRVMGVLYVLEGSILGAHSVIRQAASLGFNDRSGARHLSVQTSALAGWKQFLTCLEKETALDREVAASAACETFDEAVTAMTLAFPDRNPA
ncbi:biliverdin-producing heme oxygenase [Acetobacter sicerae]|uniref:Biliverdin-producing heme oxygenase n=1 Tax=Acetobacter sicerae TaxID=85325 RepID=A0ABS8W041_9PROT|nr:biliverdin-producing heme oxygenase [Acetobacter sicerae]MCE0744622.1 biliverdin-producing heme oxygenase [Acetobacter sicerae]